MLTRNSRIWLAALLAVACFVAIALQHSSANIDVDNDITLHLKTPKPAVRIAKAQDVLESANDDLTSNATLGFEKVFAINLPSRRDKRHGILLASKLTGFNVDFIDGVDPATIANTSLPAKYTADKPLKSGVLGCWAAHMDFLARVVEDDLSTALVLEDDVDWDIRLSTQLKDFAAMSNAILATSSATRIRFETLNTNRVPQIGHSPYGEGWDVLLVGNCGVDINLKRAHVVHAHDDTVADLAHLKIYGDPDNLRLNPHPSHARLAGYAIEQTCTYAYAVTQQAARRLLLDLGLERLDAPIDYMLRDWCEGKYGEQGLPRRCIGVLPSLFDSYRREGSAEGDSDIDGDKNEVGYRHQAVTLNIRKSVRQNLRHLLDGKEPIDQYPNFKFGKSNST